MKKILLICASILFFAVIISAFILQRNAAQKLTRIIEDSSIAYETLKLRIIRPSVHFGNVSIPLEGTEESMQAENIHIRTSIRNMIALMRSPDTTHMSRIHINAHHVTVYDKTPLTIEQGNVHIQGNLNPAAINQLTLNDIQYMKFSLRNIETNIQLNPFFAMLIGNDTPLTSGDPILLQQLNAETTINVQQIDIQSFMLESEHLQAEANGIIALGENMDPHGINASIRFVTLEEGFHRALSGLSMLIFQTVIPDAPFTAQLTYTVGSPPSLTIEK